jgi:hypothetical protein
MFGTLALLDGHVNVEVMVDSYDAFSQPPKGVS